MQLFYANQVDLKSGKLSPEESKHAIKVLRKNVGDTIFLLDGIGNLITGEIISVEGKNCVFKIIQEEFFENQLLPLHVAMAPTKNIDRFEFFIEKAIEMGISEITPVYSEHSERKRINEERISKRIIAACKQSKAYHFPKLNPGISLSEFIDAQDVKTEKYIAHCNENEKKTNINSLDLKKSTLILIGPEGDFSQKEIEKAKAKKFKSLDLGERRLRTETAGLFCVAAFSLANQ